MIFDSEEIDILCGTLIYHLCVEHQKVLQIFLRERKESDMSFAFMLMIIWLEEVDGLQG